MSRQFDHEKQIVYQEASAFIVWLTPIPQRLPKCLAVIDQLDRASLSIPLKKANSDYRLDEQNLE